MLFVVLQWILPHLYTSRTLSEITYLCLLLPKLNLFSLVCDSWSVFSSSPYYYYYYYYHHHHHHHHYLLWLSCRLFTIIPETYHVSKVYRVAALLYLQYILHRMLFPTFNILYFYICTSSSVCAVRNTAVFWSSLSFYFPDTHCSRNV